MRVAERAEETAFLFRQTGWPGHRRRETVASAVRCMVAEINPLCNRNCPESGSRTSFSVILRAFPLGCGLVVACGQIRPAREGPMRGTMMDFPLTLPTILERSGKIFPRVEIVSRKPDRSILRTCYGEFYRRACRLAAALTKLGLRTGDRIASMMWNHAGHLEAFFGVPCAGGLLHTLNLRLHPHEIAGIAKHAGDRFLLIDDVLLPVYEKFREDAPFERVIVVPYGCGTVPEGFLNYEELLAEASDDFRYPETDENDGAAMCFPSGTTGFSKGVIYSHRALVLHSFAQPLPDSLSLSCHDTVLPVAPMFHANAWGLPFTCAMM